MGRRTVVANLEEIVLAHAGLLAQLLHPGAHLARHGLVEHVSIRSSVEDNDTAPGGVGIHLARVARVDKVDRDVVLIKDLALDGDRARLHKARELLGAQRTDLGLDGLVCLAEAVAQPPVVWVALQRHAAPRLAHRLSVHLPHVELLAHILLQLADGGERLAVRVDERHLRQRCAHGQVAALAQRAARLDDGPHHLDVGFHLRVDGCVIDLGDHQKVDRRWRIRDSTPQVLIDVLGEEGRQRRHHPAEHHHHLEQGGERRAPLGRAALARKALLVHPDIPIGQLVDEIKQARHNGV
mmetsp:Transcript_8962/g.29673  ORF Transcript_8962/g.29673 Transcript_8962/m.29673 type:complete len:296 (+) Transcript_8962:633-1520(+)